MTMVKKAIVTVLAAAIVIFGFTAPASANEVQAWSCDTDVSPDTAHDGSQIFVAVCEASSGSVRALWYTYGNRLMISDYYTNSYATEVDFNNKTRGTWYHPRSNKHEENVYNLANNGDYLKFRVCSSNQSNAQCSAYIDAWA